MVASCDMPGIVRGIARVGLLLLAPGLLCAGTLAAGAVPPDAPFLARWDFDAGFAGACTDVSGNGFSEV